MIGEQLRLLWAALGYFTRLPPPAGSGHDEADLGRAACYLPVVGWLVGAVCALAYAVALLVFPHTVAVLVALAAGIWLTGAIHEDGLADCLDGFGGGQDRSAILAIMKDSRVGAFAVTGLVLVLLARFAALAAMPATLVPVALVAGHALSRLAAVAVLYSLPYARDGDDSRAGVVGRGLAGRDLALAAIAGLLPTVLLSAPAHWLALVPVAVCGWMMARLFHRRLGGWTGDCLGAVQQATELVFLLSILALY